MARVGRSAFRSLTPSWPPPPTTRRRAGAPALCWWDGTQWTPHTQPMRGMSQGSQPAYPPAAAYAADRYGAVQQERVGRHRLQTAPQDDTSATSAQPEPERVQSQLRAPQDRQPTSQQPYAPAAEQPKQPPQNTGNAAPRWITGVLAAIGVIAIVSFALSHTSSGGGSGSNTAATGSAPASQAASAPSCQAQAVSWKNNGGASDADAIEGDLSGIQKAATSFQTAANSGGDLSGAESALQSASASLQSDAQSAEADLPPACIPGVRRPYAQGLADYSKAAGDYQNSVSELSSGSDDVAVGDVEAGTKAMNAGNGKINTAVTALKAFENG